MAIRGCRIEDELVTWNLELASRLQGRSCCSSREGSGWKKQDFRLGVREVEFNFGSGIGRVERSSDQSAEEREMVQDLSKTEDEQ